MNKLILSIATLPIVGAIAAFYYYSDESLLLRVIGLLVAVGVSVAIAYQSQSGKAAFAFVKASYTEVRKVVWPTRKETAQTTVFVLVATMFMGLFFFLLDSLLGWLVKVFTS